MLLNEQPLQSALAAQEKTANASTFARVGLLMYAFLISYASLYPFSNWQSIGLPMWGFLFAPMPHYWTMFDAVTNVMGYLPFGMLVVFALYPHMRGMSAAAVAILCGVLLSGGVEAIQTFLPNRVSSNLDFLTNVTGTCAGALVGMLTTHTFLEESRLLHLRQRWFVPEAGRGLIVVGLWPLAQIYPQGYLFGHGHIMPVLSDWISAWTQAPVNLVALLKLDIDLTAQESWLIETLITACGVTGAALALSCIIRKQAPRAALIVALVAAAFAVKLMANALLLTPQNAFAWLTPGAKGGLLIGAMMVAGLAYAPPAAQRRLAAFSLIVSLVAINMLSANPYFESTMQAWFQGKFLNFNGAARFLSLCWPLFALWFLLHPVHRLKRK